MFLERELKEAKVMFSYYKKNNIEYKIGENKNEREKSRVCGKS